MTAGCCLSGCKQACPLVGTINAEHGSLNIPKRYTTPAGLSLGEWLTTQRRVRAGQIPGNLTEQQIARLDSIGMEWGSRNDAAWERGLEEARKFREQFGNLQVPAKYKTKDDYPLGKWINNARKRRNDGKLTEERIRQLDQMGMIWSVFDAKWEQGYALAAVYAQEYGNLDVPRDYKTADGKTLGRWIQNQELAYEQKKLSADQIKRLETIGMQWGSRYDRQWNEVYQAAKRYFEANGNLDVPVAYVSPEGYALGKWVRRQQYAYRNPEKSNAILSQERIELLDAIGMQWEKPDSWQHRYELAQEYKKECGNLEIPAKYKTADGIWLSRWVYNQKRLLQSGSGKLSEEQKKKLKESYWGIMSKFQHDVMLKIVKIIDLVMITIPFALCWELYYSYQVYAKFGWRGNWTMIGLFAVLFFLLGKVYDAFWMSLQRISELIYGQVLAAMATDGILYIVICLMARRLCNLLPGIAAIAGQVVMATLWVRCAHSWYFRTFPPQPTAVVYDVRHGLEKLINEYGLSKKYDVKMTLNVEECLNDLSLLDGMQSVFISGVHSHERNIILKYCVGQGINVFVIPRVGDVIMSGAQPMHMFHLPMLRVGRYMASPEFLFVKRAMDIVISLAALVILSPVFLITAIAVKSDGGPAFYKQVRLTKDGKPFEILKFRSMRVDAEKDGVARLSTGDKDDRITKVGHVIRACRLDELPQLLNILKGDLSIVGPRPERPEIAAQYCEEMPEFALRLQAKAGLTGYAQVYGKYNTTPYDKLQMDLMYIAHPSLVEDLKIMLATVKILFMPESTEGVAEGQTTAMGQETK